MTQSTEQERAEFTDGAWYWVEKEGRHDEPPKIAPAMYRADCDAWYSWEFSGISTEYLKVMEPCVRHEQAARRAPAAPVPQGWKPVPMEPTPEQLLKVYKQTGVSRKELADLWTAMLAAAPQPPEAYGLKSGNRTTKPEASIVHMPEPVGYLNTHGTYERTQEHKEELRCAKGKELEYLIKSRTAVYTEQQVRQLLAAHGIGKDKA